MTRTRASTDASPMRRVAGYAFVALSFGAAVALLSVLWDRVDVPIEVVEVSGELTGAEALLRIAALAAGYRLGNNTIYVPGGAPVVSCGRWTVNTTELHARGYDTGTVVHAELPSSETIIAWAKALLQL